MKDDNIGIRRYSNYTVDELLLRFLLTSLASSIQGRLRSDAGYLASNIHEGKSLALLLFSIKVSSNCGRESKKHALVEPPNAFQVEGAEIRKRNAIRLERG